MIRKFLRLYSLQIALAVAAVIAVAAIALWIAHAGRNNEVALVSDNKIDITPEQIESIKAIGEWEFLSIADEELVDTTRRGFFSNDRLARIYYGTMRIGINMQRVKPDWINASGDTVTMILPPVGLLDNDFIDEARTRSFYESGRWTAADREAMYKRAHRMMKRKGLTAANIRIAQDNADAQLRRMMRTMGFNTVIIRFEK